MQPGKIIIIGAGATGLMAAYELIKAGREVLIVEARDRAGGRIHTLLNDTFSMPVELGAEFIHGALPVTLQLLQQAGISYEPVSGSTWQMKSGELQQNENYFEDWALLEERLAGLQHDMTVADFINTFFSDDKHAALRASIRGFAEGYDAADISKASTLALRAEWLDEEATTNFRVKGGYGQMISYLLQQCRDAGAAVELNCIAREINWKRHEVIIKCLDGRSFTGSQVIVTVPLGILQQRIAGKSTLSFVPPIPERIKALEWMGYGAVIKVLIEFKTKFWKSALIKKQFGRDTDDLSFLISDEPVPTWWTQHPEEYALLTGWLAGPAAAKWQDATEQFIFENALLSLAAIFKMDIDELKDNVAAWQVANWTADPYAMGAYAYATLDTATSIALLGHPVEDTLFFAGEAFYHGPAMGTVEAALTSAIAVTHRMLQRVD